MDIEDKKICYICKQEKPIRSFSKNKTRAHSYCRDCKRKYDKKRYKENERLRIKARQNRRKQRLAIKKFISDYLKKNPCARCGEDDIDVLEFDHLKNKEFEIASAVRRLYSIKKISKEIEKCQVLCANCHRKKTKEYWRSLKNKGLI